MFLGEYDYKLDEKGRVPIPPKVPGRIEGWYYSYSWP